MERQRRRRWQCDGHSDLGGLRGGVSVRSELDAEASTPLIQDRRVIAIDVDRHPALYEAITDHIGERSSLCADVDGNRRLDDGECEDDNWLGQGLAGLD